MKSIIPFWKFIPSFFILALLSLSSCEEEESSIVIKYSFSSYEIESEVLAFNMNGESVESTEVFNQDGFSFDKDRGFEPADEIELLSNSEALFSYSSERFGTQLLNAKYHRTDNEIHFKIEPINEASDTLNIIFEEEGSLIKANAYGTKLKIKGQSTEEVFVSSTDYGTVKIEEILDIMSENDTLYVQEFQVTYTQE
ncbi:MAG: hypothetical protein AAF600_15790 [Bacteroidota bacterium]